MYKLSPVPPTASTAISRELDATERARLAELEPIIDRGLASFVEVGNALLEISDRRLYRETHSTFKGYVADKWQMTAARAYQLCDAAQVIKSLPPEKSTDVDNEAQARELGKLPPEHRLEVLEDAARQGTITAPAIAKAARAWHEQRVITEIIRLHNEQMEIDRSVLDDAIRLGQVLTDVKAKVPQREWSAFVKTLPFDARTVRRYMDFYAYRDQLKALSGVERHREIIRRMYGDLESATATTGRAGL